MDLNTLKNLKGYFEETRGVGHTMALLNGARNTMDATIMVNSEWLARDLKKECPHAMIVTPKSIDELRGANRPLLIDNSVMVEILEKAIAGQRFIDNQI